MPSRSGPFNAILSTTLLCDIDKIGPEGDYFVGFFFKNSSNESFIITAKHCLEAHPEEIYPRFRSVSDPRGLSRDKVIPLWEDGEPVWRVHPSADIAAIPLDLDIPSFEEGTRFEQRWPHKYLKDDYSEEATVHHEVYASAFTPEHIPGRYGETGDRLPFAGDEVHVITYDYTRDMELAFENEEIIKTDTLPKIRRLTISTPYRFDYRDEPVFLSEGRLFMGSSGCPVLYLSSSQVYSEEAEGLIPIRKPILIGVHGAMVKGPLGAEMLNLYMSVRSEEILPLTGDLPTEWDTTPDI